MIHGSMQTNNLSNSPKEKSLTRSNIICNLSFIIQLSHYHQTYEFPPVHMEYKQCEKHCVQDVVQSCWEFIQLPQERDGMIAGIATTTVSLKLQLHKQVITKRSSKQTSRL
jgi:hypothetical protein